MRGIKLPINSRAFPLPQKSGPLFTTDSFFDSPRCGAKKTQERNPMALFRNHYVCAACDGHWIAESAEVLDIDCPHCRAYDVTAYRSDNLTAAPTSIEKDLVAVLNATAEKMRAMASGMASGATGDKAGTKARPVIRSKGRGAARVAVH
jgi:hypothetical protein